MLAEILFASLRAPAHEPESVVGTLADRLLALLELKRAVSGRRTAISLDLGNCAGANPIPPLFVRRLVERVRAEGARDIFATDSPDAVRNGATRGYTAEVLGCPVVSNTGTADLYVYPRTITPPHGPLTQVNVAGEIADVEVLIHLSHVRSSGSSGFAGAARNLSMAAVDTITRARLHALEGGLDCDCEKCTRCRACVEQCPAGAIAVNERGAWSIRKEHCRGCHQCVAACNQQAIIPMCGGHLDFQRGLALTAAEVLRPFEPTRLLFISFLVDITASCACWGMTSPRLVPNIGILAGSDIVAIEQASLDLIRVEDLIPGALPSQTELAANGHLFERLHGGDPHVVVEHLAHAGLGVRQYRLIEVR